MSTVQASSPLLSIPRKTTSEVDYSSPIRQIISTTYGEAADRYSEEISTLNRTRQDAVRGSAGSDTTARDLLYRYFGQLELLELRFPEIRVPFPWNDAFNPSKNISQLSLAYEKASVIFNIAATLSALASSQNRSSPEGLKRSFNFFRAAAGMFTYINDNFLHAPSTDLGRDLVKILVTLMSAQATEVFLERMNEEKRSPGLKSKICAQIAAVYAGTVEEVKEHVGKGIFDRCWLILVQTKAKYFASLAQYNRAQADTTSSKQGDALARFTLAETLAKEAYRTSLTWGSSFYVNAAASAAATLPPEAGPSLQELCKSHSTVVGEAKTAALKDNDLIYHAIVPSEASLAQIEKAANVAEPIPIQEIYANPDVQKLVGPDIFIKLVPLSVIESSSLYSEEKAKILRNEGERCDMADGELQATLEHLGLPGSLAKFGAASSSSQDQTMATMADPGGRVRSWSHEIRAEESHKRLDSSVGELSQLRDRAISDLEYCSRELDVEQRECEQARVRFDYHFEQSPSGSHTKSWRADVKNDKDAVGQARASDDQVLALWSSVREDVGVLAAGEDAVEQVFAEAVARADHAGSGSNGGNSLLDLDLPDEEGDEMQKRISAIHESISKLSKLKKERFDTLADLKERVHNDDISQLLILNRKSQNVEPTLFAAELEKFRPHQARIQATIQHQQTALQAVQSMYAQLVQGKKGKEIQNRFAKAERAKKDLQARYKRAYDAYKEVRMGVTKGTDFYRELAGLVGTLRSEVAQFVSSRANERSHMISSAEMKQRLAGSGSQAQDTGLDRSFSGLSMDNSRSPAPPGAYHTQLPSRAVSGSNYPSTMPPKPQQPQQSYGYAAPQHPSSPSPYSGYANSGLNPGYPSSSGTPSLPTKPPTQSSPYQSGPHRQPSSGGLPPPPSQPSYQHQGSLPPPPGSLSYSSSTSSSYASAPPPPSSSYSTPPPPPPQQHSPYNSGYQPSYSQPSIISQHTGASFQSSIYGHQPQQPQQPQQYGQQSYQQQQHGSPYGQPQPQVPPRPPTQQQQYGQPQQPYQAPPQQYQQPGQQQYRY